MRVVSFSLVFPFWAACALGALDGNIKEGSEFWGESIEQQLEDEDTGSIAEGRGSAEEQDSLQQDEGQRAPLGVRSRDEALGEDQDFPLRKVQRTQEQEKLDQMFLMGVKTGVGKDRLKKALEVGADINVETTYGNTALELALGRKATTKTVLKFLLDCGAKIRSQKVWDTLLERLPKVDVLRKYGHLRYYSHEEGTVDEEPEAVIADFEQNPGNEATGDDVPRADQEEPPPPLHLAVFDADEGAVRHILRTNFQVDINNDRDAYGRTALEVAIAVENAPMIELLIMNGARVPVEHRNNGAVIDAIAHMQRGVPGAQPLAQPEVDVTQARIDAVDLDPNLLELASVLCSFDSW